LTDNYGSETTWNLKDANGFIVAQGGPYTNNFTASLEIGIPSSNECYTFTINDSIGDGICCAYGIGSYSISDDSGNEIFSGGEFSSTEATTFRVGESLGLNSFTDENLKIFPNPSNGIFTVKTTITNSSYKIYNLVGQTIKSGFINNGENSIDIRNSKDGIYFLMIKSTNGEKIGYKLIKN
jgi:hypothetical protein